MAWAVDPAASAVLLLGPFAPKRSSFVANDRTSQTVVSFHTWGPSQQSLFTTSVGASLYLPTPGCKVLKLKTAFFEACWGGEVVCGAGCATAAKLVAKLVVSRKFGNTTERAPAKWGSMRSVLGPKTVVLETFQKARNNRAAWSAHIGGIIFGRMHSARFQHGSIPCME